MPARHMASFMRNHADYFARRLSLQNRASVYEHSAPGDKRIERGIIDQHNVNRALSEARSLDNWPRIIADQPFNLGVADDGNAVVLLRLHACGRGRQKQRSKKQPENRTQRRCKKDCVEHGLQINPIMAKEKAGFARHTNL